MNILKTAEKSVFQKYKFFNMVSNIFYSIEYLSSFKIRNSNRKFNKIESGKACFIIGNGPSLKNFNLDLIKNYDCITVNNMIETEKFGIIRPKYHVIMDMNVFGKISNFEKYAFNNNFCNFFINYKCPKYNINNVHYIYSRKICTKSKLKNNLCKNLYGFLNVIPYCIEIAISLGYKHIYLLGVDFSFFVRSNASHFYESNRSETLFSDLFGSALACKQFEFVADYCEKNKVELYNLTEGTYLDVVKRKSINEIL